jgi:hypothetical protein
MGIQTDTNLHGQQYALLGTILYIGILIGEVGVVKSFKLTYQFPVNRLIQRVRIAKFLGCLVILWLSHTLSPCTTSQLIMLSGRNRLLSCCL